MSATLKATRKQAASVIAATFPEYTGRKIAVVFTERVMFYDTNWSGGTHNGYAAVKADGRTAKLNVPAPWCNPVEGATFELPADTLLVCHSHFCGHDLGLTIYAHPTHLPKWLAA
jgi:hypothetical protein